MPSAHFEMELFQSFNAKTQGCKDAKVDEGQFEMPSSSPLRLCVFALNWLRSSST